MNKLVINHLEKLFVTSDAATIVEELEVAHPAAKMLCRSAKTQVEELGDGSNLVITFAGELLQQAESLLRLGVHPTDVVEGYKRATEKALALLEAEVAWTLDNPRDKAALTRALTPVVASKQLGYEELVAGLVADACLAVMPAAPKKASVTVDNVRVAKLIGGTISDSQIVRGVVVQRDAEGSVKHVPKAKIAVFGCSIESTSAETKGTVVSARRRRRHAVVLRRGSRVRGGPGDSRWYLAGAAYPEFWDAAVYAAQSVIATPMRSHRHLQLARTRTGNPQRGGAHELQQGRGAADGGEHPRDCRDGREGHRRGRLHL
jgi:hypothetical protein